MKKLIVDWVEENNSADIWIRTCKFGGIVVATIDKKMYDFIMEKKTYEVDLICIEFECLELKLNPAQYCKKHLENFGKVWEENKEKYIGVENV